MFHFYRMAKIKKRYKISGAALLSLLLAAVVLFFAIQGKRFQNRLVTGFLDRISEKTGTKVHIGEVSFKGINKINLRDVFVEDLHGDTLLYVNQVNTHFLSYSFSRRSLRFGASELDSAKFYLITDTAGILNFDYYLQMLGAYDPPDTTRPAFKLNIRSIRANTLLFWLRDRSSATDTGGIDFGDMYVDIHHANIRKFSVERDRVHMNIQSLVFTEKSGFDVEDFSAIMALSKNHLQFDYLSIRTPKSELAEGAVKFSFHRFKNFGKETLFDSINIQGDISKSVINLSDVGYFTPFFKGIEEAYQFSGKFQGPLSNFKAREVTLSSGSSTLLHGNFDISGLPDIQQSFLYLDIASFESSTAEFPKVFHSFTRNRLVLPEVLNQAGWFAYKGNFTGYIDNFVSYGTLRSGFGNITTDISIRPESRSKVKLKGFVGGQNFRLGRLLKNDLVGEISLDATVEGIFGNNSFSTSLASTVHDVEINRYHYRNIDIKGLFTNQMYDGKVSMHDENIEFEFDGNIRFGKKVNAFDFKANIVHANLYRLNIDRSDPASYASCYVIAKGGGTSIGNLTGEVNVVNSLFSKTGRQLQLFDVRLTAENTENFNSLRLQSDFLDASLSGRYDLTTLRQTIYKLANRLAPAAQYTDTLIAKGHINDFDLSLTFKNTQQVTEYFTPSIAISTGSVVKAGLHPNGQIFLNSDCKHLRFGGRVVDDLTIKSTGADSSLEMSVTAGRIFLTGAYYLQNIRLNGRIADNQLKIDSHWGANSSDSQQGHLLGSLHIIEDQPGEPLFRINIEESRITLNDTLWKISPSEINIGNRTVSIDNLLVKSSSGSIALAGHISATGTDALMARVSHFNLSNINNFLNKEKLVLGGDVSGSVTFSNLYRQPVIEANLETEKLSLNNKLLGDATVQSSWENDKQQLNLDAVIRRGKLETFILEGNIQQPGTRLNLDCRLDKLRIDPLDPFFTDIFSDFKGLASGRVQISGDVQYPLINGQLEFDRAGFRVDYLNTRYGFTDKILVTNNQIYFKSVEILDAEGNSARLNGNIYLDRLRDVNLTLELLPEKMLMLNTISADNPDFYGKAYGTGKVNIHGNLRNISISVKARSDRNTRLSIPVKYTRVADTYSFVKFTRKADPDESHKKPDYQVDLRGLLLDFDLQLTPEAEVQIIFDEKMGDIMKGRGTGSIVMEINTKGAFNMYGNYTISEGDYLFTLQNVINKKFTIRPNSTITWNGKPLEADLNIDAYYRVKTSLYNLFIEEKSDEYKKRIPVECQLTMTNKLTNPDIAFGIILPTADFETRNKLQERIGSEDELTRQFLSLLVLNTFYVDPAARESSGAETASTGNVVGVTTSELLSNQLSNWLSQINNNIDVGVNYRPGDELTTDEVELALSTQFLNDRVSVHTNFDFGGTQVQTEDATAATNSSTTTIVGDFVVEYYITKNGKLRMKVFNRANDDLYDEKSDYTQGIGLFYKEDFNNVQELLNRYWTSMFAKSTKVESN